MADLNRSFSAGLLGAVALATLMHAQAARAEIVVPFSVYESSDRFTVVNRSSDLYVYSFSVDFDNGRYISGSTAQTNWSACGSFCSSSIGVINYYNIDGASDMLGDLADDVGPGQTSNKFVYNFLEVDPIYTIDYVDSLGNTGSIRGPTILSGVPEPATWAMFGLGFVATALQLRRRQAVLTPSAG